jgi:hypothetical protein
MDQRWSKFKAKKDPEEAFGALSEWQISVFTIYRTL